VTITVKVKTPEMQFSGEQPVSPAFSPGYTVTTHGDGFFYCCSDRYEIASHDVHGKLRELVRHSAARSAVTENDRAKYRESVLAQADDATWRAHFAAVLKEIMTTSILAPALPPWERFDFPRRLIAKAGCRGYVLAGIEEVVTEVQQCLECTAKHPG
jgi:hypothetical protein